MLAKRVEELTVTNIELGQLLDGPTSHADVDGTFKALQRTFIQIEKSKPARR